MKQSLWEKSVLAVLPVLEGRATAVEIAEAAVAAADYVVAAQEARFGAGELLNEPLAKEEASVIEDAEARAAILEAFKGQMTLRGPDVVRWVRNRLRKKPKKEQVYRLLQEMVVEGVLWVELAYQREEMWGGKHMAHVVLYANPEEVKSLDPDFYGQLEAVGGVLISLQWMKEIPAWVERAKAKRNSSQQAEGGAE